MIFNQRTFPVHKKLRELVQSGKWGKLLRVSWVVTDWYRPDAYYASAGWRGTWRGDGGGTLLNQCPHNLDLLQWICGMPSRVQGFCHEGKYHPIAVEDDVTIYMEWENGATGVFTASTGEAAGVNRLEITLEDGMLVLDKGRLSLYALEKPEREYRRDTENLYGIPQGSRKEICCEEQTDGHTAVLQNFVRAAEWGEPLTAPGEEGRKSLLLSNAVYLSSWERRMVELPVPDSEAELEFEERFEAWLWKKRRAEEGTGQKE